MYPILEKRIDKFTPKPGSHTSFDILREPIGKETQHIIGKFVNYSKQLYLAANLNQLTLIASLLQVYRL